MSRRCSSLLLPDNFRKTVVSCQSNHLSQRIIATALVYHFLKSINLVKLLSYKSLLNIKQTDFIPGNLQPIFHDYQTRTGVQT